jgi:hypothetical protein
MDESTRDTREEPEDLKGDASGSSSQRSARRLIDVARASSAPQPGARAQLAIYRMPKYLEWAVESLARHMLRGKDAALNVRCRSDCQGWHISAPSTRSSKFGAKQSETVTPRP